MIELQNPTHVTADYVGEPGNRTFLVQAEQDGERIAAVVEKTQVASLAEALVELLARLDLVPAIDYDRDAMELREPLGERWRAGQIGVGLDPDARRMLLELTELVLPDEDDDTGEAALDDPAADVPEGEEREPEQVRVWLDLQVARRLASHATETVGEGRRRVDPQTNGHGPAVR